MRDQDRNVWTLGSGKFSTRAEDFDTAFYSFGLTGYSMYILDEGMYSILNQITRQLRQRYKHKWNET